jgi:hypothetical protein
VSGAPIRVGVTGTTWRGAVGPGGELSASGEHALDWWVAADDRWHHPVDEPSVRQRRIGGAPVVETKVRVPGGDVVMTTFVVPDDGGLTIVGITNDSPAPCAIAFSRRTLLSTRLPTTLPDDAPVPAGAVAYPLPHQQSMQVAIAHDGRVGGTVPSVPDAAQVAAGWVRQCARGMRLDGTDDLIDEGFVTARSTVILDGPDVPGVDAVERLLRCVEWVRLGEPAEPLVDLVAADVATVARSARRRGDWAADAALRGAAEVLRAAGEGRAAGDAWRMAERSTIVEERGPVTALDPAGDAGRWLANQRALVVRDAGAEVELFPGGVEPGRNIAVHDVPVDRGMVSAAVRWHGERPALLWEAVGDVAVVAPTLDPTFRSDRARGEALLGVAG